MTHRSFQEQLPRLDGSPKWREILPLCRLSLGEIWEDPKRGHRVGRVDLSSPEFREMIPQEVADLVISDPPYNLSVGKKNSPQLFQKSLEEYLEFSRGWVSNALWAMKKQAHLYIWMGGDRKNHFCPLPEFLLLMREFPELHSRNWITVRNQRGYGTSKNWMWVRQEILHYSRGNPPFQVVYTDIPKRVRGYYKKVKGKRQENLERSRSPYQRPGNVWVDIQQVFYRMEENVPGCYAQKPLKAMERLILSSSQKGDLVLDFFCHSGTTLLAGERTGRTVWSFDIDPVFCEITIRRLEHYRKTGKTGWQWHSPFPELQKKEKKT